MSCYRNYGPFNARSAPEPYRRSNDLPPFPELVEEGTEVRKLEADDTGPAGLWGIVMFVGSRDCLIRWWGKQEPERYTAEIPNNRYEVAR